MDIEAKTYGEYLKMYGSMMIDLSKSEDYLNKLREGGKNLSDFEQALRTRIIKAEKEAA